MDITHATGLVGHKLVVGKHTWKRANGLDRAGGALHWKSTTVTRLGSQQVGINGPSIGNHSGGGDRQSLAAGQAVGWPSIDKARKLPPGVATSPAAIGATTVAKVGLKMLAFLGKHTWKRANGLDRADGARHWKSTMVARLSSQLVGIDGPSEGNHGGGGNRQSLAAGWLESREIAVGSGNVTSSDRGHNGGQGWSQNVVLGEGMCLGW